jgi:SNF2 family DNA or RNA helicase
LKSWPIRFLLADDAGAGKTIMTGLTIRELLSRRLIQRVLIVPPAGLVGNWQRELRVLFRIQARIIRGARRQRAIPS